MPALTDNRERLYTLPEVAQETGIPRRQIEYAVERGDLVPAGPKIGRTRTLTDEQLEQAKQAAKLVAIGVMFWAAYKVVENGWQPPAAAVA